VVVDAGGGNLGDKLRSPDNVTVLDAHLAAVLRENNEECIRLRPVLQGKPQCAVVAPLDTRSRCPVHCQPGHEIEMRSGVILETYWWRHIDHSIDQFSLLEVRHRLVTPLELLCGQPISVLQRRYPRSWWSCRHFHLGLLRCGHASFPPLGVTPAP